MPKSKPKDKPKRGPGGNNNPNGRPLTDAVPQPQDLERAIKLAMVRGLIQLVSWSPYMKKTNQEQAEFLGVSPTHLSAWRNGNLDGVSIKRLREIMGGLGVRIEMDIRIIRGFLPDREFEPRLTFPGEKDILHQESYPAKH